MREIDGSEGGGQQLRTALTLSIVENDPFRIEDIRGSRPTPGLRPQHLAAVRAAATLSDADVEGDDVDSETLTFRPDSLTTDPLSVDVGTAGSLTLVFDTLLPVAAHLPETLPVTVTGGTDVKWSPPFDYTRHVKLPLLERFGLDADLTLDRRGFYPAGGGEATLRLAPSSLSPFDLRDRGQLERATVHSVASESLEDRDVADRQAAHAEALLDEMDVSADTVVTYAESASPGSALVVRVTYGRTLAGFDALGERGTTSEEVAESAVAAFAAWRGGNGAVDPHMGDQVLVFLALAGGTVSVPRVTDHVETNVATIREFGYDVSIHERDSGAILSAE